MNGWFLLHLGFILTGLTAFAVAVLSAAVYLFQSSQLKSKHPGKIFLKLPSLDTLDKIHFRSLGGGVIFFSLGILSGFFWAKNLSELHRLLYDPTVVLSLAVCLLYWVLLSLRLLKLKRGQKIATGTLLVFALLSITVLNSYREPTMFHKGF